MEDWDQIKISSRLNAGQRLRRLEGQKMAGRSSDGQTRAYTFSAAGPVQSKRFDAVEQTTWKSTPTTQVPLTYKDQLNLHSGRG